MTEFGCEIEELATDPGITEFLDEYLKAVALRALTGSNETQNRILKDLGLLDDPDTLLSLELVVIEAQKLQQEKDKLR